MSTLHTVSTFLSCLSLVALSSAAPEVDRRLVVTMLVVAVLAGCVELHQSMP